MKNLKLCIRGFEILYVFIVPIYLYGWLLGVLIASALTSLLHIAQLLEIRNLLDDKHDGK